MLTRIGVVVNKVFPKTVSRLEALFILNYQIQSYSAVARRLKIANHGQIHLQYTNMINAMTGDYNKAKYWWMKKLKQYR